MTSKRELRAEIERIDRLRITAFDDGWRLAAEILGLGDPAPWSAHLARVADAAKAEGYREGYGQGEAKYAEGYAEGWSAALSASQPHPLPDVAPEPAEPAEGELNAFSAYCGFFCHCCGPRPDVWQPGSVTR